MHKSVEYEEEIINTEGKENKENNNNTKFKSSNSKFHETKRQKNDGGVSQINHLILSNSKKKPSNNRIINNNYNINYNLGAVNSNLIAVSSGNHQEEKEKEKENDNNKYIFRVEDDNYKLDREVFKILFPFIQLLRHSFIENKVSKINFILIFSD